MICPHCKNEITEETANPLPVKINGDEYRMTKQTVVPGRLISNYYRNGKRIKYQRALAVPLMLVTKEGKL